MTTRRQKCWPRCASADDEDGYCRRCSPRPKSPDEVVADIRAAIKATPVEHLWIDPHVTSGYGEFLLEWWGAGEHKLSISIIGAEIELLRVWGPNMRTEMASVSNPDMAAMRAAWIWLMGGAL